MAGSADSARGFGSATVAMMGATAIVAPMLPLYPDVSPEIIAIANWFRPWLHDRDRFPVLAGQAVLRRYAE